MRVLVWGWGGGSVCLPMSVCVTVFLYLCGDGGGGCRYQHDLVADIPCTRSHLSPVLHLLRLKGVFRGQCQCVNNPSAADW